MTTAANNLTLDIIQEALFAIDANLSREKWARIGMALKSELGDAGLGLFDSWSKRGDGYNARDCADTWKSIRPGGGVGIATLIWEAQQHGWAANDNAPRLTPEQVEARRAEREAERKAADAEVRRLQGEAAKLANLTWQAAAPAGDAHPYLRAKGVAAYGLGVGEWPLVNASGEVFRKVPDALLVPIMDAANGRLISLQGIYTDDNGETCKRYLRNGRKRGGVHFIGTPPAAGQPLVMAEGYATGATIHRLTGWFTVVTFDAPNLASVAETLREQFAQATIIIAADNDQWTKLGDIENPGVHYGKRAADAARGCLVIPQFLNTDTRPTDFNDLAALEGDDAARGQLLATPVAAPAGGADVAPANDNRSIDYFTPLPDVGSKGKPRSTIENLAEICRRLGVKVRYNVIAKNQEIIIPGEGYLPDNRDNDTFARLESECAKFDMPIGNLNGFVGHIAGQNAFNPVERWITSKPWDGTPRLQALLDTVTPVEDRRLPDGRSLKEVLMRRWMMSAVAGAFSPDGVSAHGILVFQGPQYLGKTMWFKQLAPDHLGILQDGMMLNPADRDSVKQAVSFWLVELGELDATFRKTDLAALKSFVTRKQDVLRLPYARKDSAFARRTVFFGSVNPREFLHDVTGNRRYWTVECAAIDLEAQRRLDVQQIWAEAYALWQGGEPHFLAGDEMDALNNSNQEFQAADPIEERLGTRLDWSAPQSTWVYRSATDVLVSLGIVNPGRSDATRAGMAIRKLNGGQSKRAATCTMHLVPPLVGVRSYDQPY